MSKKFQIDEQGLYDILNGSTFLASGGGGSIDNGADLIKEILKDKKWKGFITCVSSQKIHNEDNLGVVCAPAAPKALKKYGLGQSPIKSFELMEKMYNNTNPFSSKKKKGFKYNYAIPIETGCVAHLMAIQIAMKKGIKVLDADGAGRAYPKMSMNSFANSGIPIGPMSLATENSVKQGGADFLLNIKNADNVDQIFRNLLGTDEFNNVSSSTCFSMNGKEVKREGVVINNTISRARKLGKILRKSKGHAVKDVMTFLNNEFGFATILIQGKVTEIIQTVQGGFDVGIIKVSDGKKEIEILNQNENILALSNQKNHPLAMGPDLICYMDEEGNVYSNPDLKKDKNIVVIAVKADKEYNTKYIQNEFKGIFEGLNYFGPYIPVNKLNK